MSHTTSRAVLRILSIVASAFLSSESTQPSTSRIMSCRAFLICTSLLLFPPSLFLYSLFSFIGRNHLIPPRTNTALPLIPLSRDYRTIPLCPPPTIRSPTHSPPNSSPHPTQNPPTIPLSRDCRTIQLSSAPTIHSPTHFPLTPRPTQNPPTIPLSRERRTIPLSRDCRTNFTEPFEQGPSLILIWIRLLIDS